MHDEGRIPIPINWTYLRLVSCLRVTSCVAENLLIDFALKKEATTSISPSYVDVLLLFSSRRRAKLPMRAEEQVFAFSFQLEDALDGRMG
jgi:hypothetical protein